MFKVYISDSVYDRIINVEEQRAMSGRSNLYKLLKQQPVQLLTEEDTEKLKEHPEDVLKNPSSLYILNITHAEALAIQKSYGVMCVSGDSPNISPLIDINDIHIAKEQEKLGRGWDTVLDSVEPLPSNALLLTDRYLFAFKYPNAANGIANIKSILDELLPKQFQGGDYHITVIFDNKAKDVDYTFEEIALLLEDVKQQLHREYPITMEVLGITPKCPIYKKFHNRMIMSNYYLVEASHKLAAFNKDMGTTRQLLLPLALFTESSLNANSTPPLDAINHTLSTLRKFSKSLSYLPESAHSTYLYAVNGVRKDKCLSIRNRLIK
jgi:hypothetical protein